MRSKLKFKINLKQRPQLGVFLPKCFFPSGAVKILQAFLVTNMRATCLYLSYLLWIYRQCLLQDTRHEHTQDAAFFVVLFPVALTQNTVTN
jgi:hypothetical protein